MQAGEARQLSDEVASQMTEDIWANIAIEIKKRSDKAFLELSVDERHMGYKYVPLLVRKKVIDKLRQLGYKVVFGKACLTLATSQFGVHITWES